MKIRKERKKSSRSGMALPGVIILLFVLSLLGTAMYSYSMQSIQSVRFASDGKKAEYLAQAGIESVAYAYQTALNTTGTVSNGLSAFFSNANSDENTIESNVVWLVYEKSTKEYKYIKDTRTAEQIAADTEAGNEWPSTTTYDVIGNFRVTISIEEREDTITVYNYDEDGNVIGNANGTVKPLPSSIKFLTAVGTSKKAVRAKTAYLSDVKNAYGPYYGDNGIIDGKYTDGESTYGAHTKSSTCAATEEFIQSGSYKTSSTLQFRFKWLNRIFGESIQPSAQTVSSETVPFALAYSSGNFILDKPKDTKNLSFVTGQSNMVSFVSRNNIFIRTGIDTTSSDGHFNTLVLKGNKIVIDGDITVSAYGFTRNSAIALINNIGTLRDLLNKKYRYATVTIDALDDTDIDNPYSAPPYDYNRSGIVYFGGNVFVNITLPNLGTYRYKAFSAGDVYYFDADVHDKYIGNLGEHVTEGHQDMGSNDGIDLFRYFLEYSLATKRYSKNVLDRFNDLIEFYYGNSSEAQTGAGEDAKAIYIKNGVAVGAYFMYNVDSDGYGTGNESDVKYNAMRKIDRDFGTGGRNDFGDTVKDIIPPKPSDASSIKWGKPRSINLGE